MGRTTKQCVVFGNNTTVTEACMECGAKSVLLLGRQPRYELQGADTVVERLTDLSIENLKRLFTEETGDAAEPEREKVEYSRQVYRPGRRGEAAVGTRGEKRRRGRKGAAGLPEAAAPAAGQLRRPSIAFAFDVEPAARRPTGAAHCTTTTTVAETSAAADDTRRRKRASPSV